MLYWNLVLGLVSHLISAIEHVEMLDGYAETIRRSYVLENARLWCKWCHVDAKCWHVSCHKCVGIRLIVHLHTNEIRAEGRMRVRFKAIPLIIDIGWALQQKLNGSWWHQVVSSMLIPVCPSSQSTFNHPHDYLNLKRRHNNTFSHHLIAPAQCTPSHPCNLLSPHVKHTILYSFV